METCLKLGKTVFFAYFAYKIYLHAFSTLFNSFLLLKSPGRIFVHMWNYQMNLKKHDDARNAF